MNCFTSIALAGACLALTSGSAQAQQKVQGQPAGQGQPGQAGQTGQKGSQLQGALGQPGAYHGGVGQTPWFNNQEILQQFKLNDQQFNQLNKSYGEAYGRYQQEMNNLAKDLSDDMRAQKVSELQQRFNKDFSKTTNDVFTDPQQRQRYNQLYMQYQGYNAFSDPTVQEKLNLTPEQRRKIGQFGQEWHKQMNELGNNYKTDRDGMAKQFNEMRKQSGERINTILTPGQQKTWQQMTGESFNFQPNAYFQSGAGSSPNPTNSGKQVPPK